MKIIKLLIVLLIMSVVIMAHEFGHAIELKKQGVQVEIISIGIDLDFVPVYSFTIDQFPGTKIKISPLLFGGYVKPATGELKALDYETSAMVFASGIKLNLISGLILFLGALLLKGAPNNKQTLTATGILAAGCLAAIVLPALFAMVIVPAAGLGLLVHIIMQKGHGLIGPVGFFKLMMEKITSAPNVLGLAAALSITIGVINALPIFPLDGGKIAEKLIQEVLSENAAKTYSIVSMVFVLGLFVRITIKDLKR